jgi:pSer/pThr/pTyr-binding forkhead associated (FHA) protein
VDERPTVERVACLVLLDEQQQHPQGTRFYLTKNSMVLGRVEGADILLPYVTISRRQCRFVLRDGAWWVVDEMSTAGTYVNHEHVSEARGAWSVRGAQRPTLHEGRLLSSSTRNPAVLL